MSDAMKVFDDYFGALKLSYPENPTAIAVAREVRDIFAADLSTLRTSLAEREAENQKLLKQWNRDLDNWNQSINDKKAAEALVAERKRQLVVLREALTECKRVIDGGTWSLTQTGIGIDDAVNATRKADAALASTSSAAERVERRIGAKVLREAADKIRCWVTNRSKNQDVADWLEERANDFENS